ncbi:MAG: DUF3043 domain-containing protein [Bifidobacteriaceae bacterium]|jgi:hypothetical protein|nr:DUF3043 domain-containing protein [Bifidobacteriaceae bacterium]
MSKENPTPKRKEAQRARLNPIVQSRSSANRKKLSKEEKKALRLKEKQLRNNQYEAMKNGDERFLQKRDKGKVRSYIRDFIDSRFSFSEYFMVIVVIVFLFMMGFGTDNQFFATYITLFMYVYLFFIVLESVYTWQKLKKSLYRKFGVAEATSQKCNAWYAIMRMLQFRPMRMPKAKHKSKKDYKLD